MMNSHMENLCEVWKSGIFWPFGNALRVIICVVLDYKLWPQLGKTNIGLLQGGKWWLGLYRLAWSKGEVRAVTISNERKLLAFIHFSLPLFSEPRIEKGCLASHVFLHKLASKSNRWNLIIWDAEVPSKQLKLIVGNLG